MKYTKHLLQIRGVLFDLGDNFVYKEDLYGEIFTTLSFDVPKFDDIKYIKQYDVVKLYFKEFDTKEDWLNATTTSDLTLIFDGYIKAIFPKFGRSEGKSYSIECNSLMGFAYERPYYLPNPESKINSIIEFGLTEVGLTDYITTEIEDGMDAYTIVSNGDNFGETLENIQENYAIHIYTTGNNKLFVHNPAWLLDNQELSSYEYDMKLNVRKIEYGNKCNWYDAVVVIGYNCIGFAYDPMAYQLKNSVQSDKVYQSVMTNPITGEPYKSWLDFQSDVAASSTIDYTKLNVLKLIRTDVVSDIEANTIALNTLLEMSKNHYISIDTQYVESQHVGELFNIINDEEIEKRQEWIIKSLTINISKNSGVQVTLTGYSNSISELPEDLVLDPSHFLRSNLISLNEKNNSTKKLVNNYLRQ